MQGARGSGNQDVRIALINTMVIVCFEAYHGNYSLADKQIQIRLLLMDKWSKQYPAATQQPLEFASPASFVIEEDLLWKFCQLELGSLSWLASRSHAQHEACAEQGSNGLKNMSYPFSIIEEARAYLNLIMRRAQALRLLRCGAYF